MVDKIRSTGAGIRSTGAGSPSHVFGILGEDTNKAEIRTESSTKRNECSQTNYEKCKGKNEEV